MRKPSPVQLCKAITDAARTAFDEFRKTHAKERFYAFALYTNGEGTLIAPTANTEEGLLRKAKEYVRKDRGKLDDRLRELRWSPCDWDLHCVGDRHFEDAEGLLDQWSLPDDLDDANTDSSARVKVFIRALKALDKEGFFGSGSARKQVVLLVMMGDQSDKHLLECARELNPGPIYDKFAEPFGQREVGKFRQVGSRKVYASKGVAVSRDGKKVATAGDSAALVWTVPGFKEVLRKRRGLVGVGDTSISPDGGFVAIGVGSLTGDEKGGFQVWDVVKQKLAFEEHSTLSGSIRAIAFSPDAALLVCAGEKKVIQVWDVQKRTRARELTGHAEWVICLRFSSDGTRLFSSGLDPESGERSTRVWDTVTGKLIARLPDGGDQIALSPDDSLLAVAPGGGSRPGVVRIWDIAKKKRVQEIEVTAECSLIPKRKKDDLECQVSAVAFSPDGKTIVVGTSWFASVGSLWDWRSGKELLVMDPGGYETLDAVAFLPDGKSVVLAGCGFEAPPLIVWDISEAVDGGGKKK